MKLIDLHTHPLLKPANSSVDPAKLETLWKEFPEPETCAQLSKSIQKAIKSTDKTSQADLTKVTRGGVNGLFIAMGPAERPFFDPHVRNPLVRLVLPRKDYRILARSVTGFCMEKINKIFDSINDTNKTGGVDYFNNELVPEYQYLLNQEKNIAYKNKFRIAKDFSDFRNIIEHEPDTIAVVLTVEGAHSFGNYLSREDFTTPYAAVQQMNDEQIKQYKFTENIRKVKTEWKEHSPLFVTLCHHFWNLLSGHCKSMSPSQNIFKPGMDAIIDQRMGMNAPITKIGETVITELLSKENGRRVLIDVKHMSIAARKRYYEILKQHRAQGDNIPVICSHTSVNLFETMNAAAAEEDDFCKDKNAWLSRFSINLCNEEIREIADSKGLIGIILNEGRMPGELGREAIKACGEGMSDAKRDVYVKLIMCNILQIVKVVNKKEAWDLICIGSDFDGVIDPFETYLNEGSLKDLPVHIMQYLSDPQFDLDWIGITANDIRTKYMFGYNAREIGEKIAFGNIMLFLERYFHDGYLKNGSNNGDNIIP